MDLAQMGTMRSREEQSLGQSHSQVEPGWSLSTLGLSQRGEPGKAGVCQELTCPETNRLQGLGTLSYAFKETQQTAELMGTISTSYP